jgi:hypothetical protein
MRRTSMWAAALIGLAVAAPSPAHAQASALPIFDAHVHYNLDIGRPVPVETVFELWRRAGIGGVLLNSRPNDGTRELLAAAPPEFRTVAFARPYVVASDAFTWFRNPAILAMIEQEIARGIYTGIGEFHIFGHDADSEGFARFVRLASQHRLWLHAHCDDYVIDRIFSLDPDARVIWAHTGMTTPPARVDDLLGRYAKLYGELSFREGILEGDALSSTWRALFMKYPERLLVGSDTWVPQRWPEVPDIMARYRAWLSQLPHEVAVRIAWRNGATLFLGE